MATIQASRPPQATRWTAEEDAQLKSLLNKGLARSVIAKRMGRSESSVHTRITCLEFKPLTKRRPCLCCGNEFSSEGPHNRLCTRCRGKETTPFHY